MTRVLTCLARLLAALTFLALPAGAQDNGEDMADPAMLVADNVYVEADSRLVATGNVEAFHDGLRLTAERIVYDQSTDQLVIDGPIRIIDADGNVITATYAEMDQGFRNGLLSGARMVLDQQLQLASVEARRVEGRFTQLSRVAVTSCQVCGKNRVPLWQIRASRVVHDQLERQMYFDDAQLRVLDVPVFYFPRLRLPDPTLKRARGFLIPTIHSSSRLGLGIKTPYFIPIGRHQDLTLTPYLSPKTRTLEFRYRRAYRSGQLTLLGGLTSDTLVDDGPRGYLFANGNFRLPRDYKLSFNLKSISDDSYLYDYGLDNKDRLASDLSLSRITYNSFMQTSVRNYRTLRDFESNSTQPRFVADYRLERRFFPGLVGGELRLAAETHGHLRQSKNDTDGPDADDEVDGRDVTRINAEMSWRNRWTLPGGIRAGLSTHLWVDHYLTEQDVTSDAEVSRAIPGIAAEFRYPMQRQGPAGGRTLLEPVLQFGWVGGERLRNPNDESTRVEFDEANLLSLSRFPASDRREHGATLAAGVRWLHQAPDGWSAALTFGRIWRETADTDFSRSSGLTGTTSDLLIAGRFANPLGLTLSARGLLDHDGSFSKAEARAGWSTTRMDLGASYLLLVPDADEDRDQTQSEWTFDGRYQLNRHWSTSSEARYDLADQRVDRVGLGLQYRNECIQVDFQVTRDYASSSIVEPSTDFDLTIALTGFGAGNSGKEYRRTCSF
ncbi:MULTISPECIES: LPS-assembly protein LptD [Mameliella]|uniref:LPS-assembly protein LptD n=1 Tax=Mameliella TaxID=1434019 RepID=UPI000B5314E7|nr:MULTISPECIES: LPS assembly protein LptD [Mameliella]MCR9274471.1 LPS assembly protein LptD [Paracoccaceae bacterium]OWV63048.1 organic solvent tolerance protein [Mameliella alba]